MYTPLVHLLVQVGDAVLDAEDVHQLLREGAGNGTAAERQMSVIRVAILSAYLERDSA